MEKQKCSRKGCILEGTNEVTRGPGRKPSCYCDQHYQEHLKNIRDRRQARIQKGLNPTCSCKNEDGTTCGQPAVAMVETISCCQKHLEEKKEYHRNYESRPEVKARRSNWRKNNPDKRKEHNRKHFLTHKEDITLNREIYKGIQWFRNFMVMKYLDRNFNFYTFCDQQSRQFVINDFEKVGLIIRNEHSLINPDSLRTRKCIDLSVKSLGLYVETKSTEATFKKEETEQQVALYQSLLDFEMANGYTKTHKATFLSWSPTGDNADMSLREFYLFIKDKIKYEYKRLGRDRFKARFPLVKYRALIRLCDKRANQLARVEKYSPKSSKYNQEDLKQGLIEKLLAGELVLKKVDMNLLREKYGQP